jgi:hypothetical protein
VAEFENPPAGVIETDGTAAHAHLIEECRFDGFNKFAIRRQAPLRHAAEIHSVAHRSDFPSPFADELRKEGV